jgi:hypothetical protein
MDSMGKSQRETLDILLGTFVCACTLAGHDDREELVDAEPVAGLMDIIVRAMCGGKRERVTLASDGISVTFELSADDETGLPFSIVRIEKNQPLVSTAGWSIE